jgi:hypothetical protein
VNKLDEGTKRHIILGAKYVGIAGFTLAGLALPPAIIPAALAAAAWPELLNDFFSRNMSEREHLRSSAVTAAALVGIRERVDAGELLRDDGWFESKGQRRSDATEILEGVLLKSRDEYEERKLPLLARILENLAFWPGVSAAEASSLIRSWERISYRQACILALFARADNANKLPLRDGDYGAGRAKDLPLETISILNDTFELYQSQLVLEPGGGSEWNGDESDCSTLGEWPEIIPNCIRLTHRGRLASRAMGLDQLIPASDLGEISRHLA